MEEVHTGKPRRHRLLTEVLQTVDSGGVGKRILLLFLLLGFVFFFAIFQKKQKIAF